MNIRTQSIFINKFKICTYILIFVLFSIELNSQNYHFTKDVSILGHLDSREFVTIGEPYLFLEDNLDLKTKLSNLYETFYHFDPIVDTLLLSLLNKYNLNLKIEVNKNYFIILNIEKKIEVHEISTQNDKNYYNDIFKVLNNRNRPCLPYLEIFDGIDNDCDGDIDEGLQYNFDFDQDNIADFYDNCKTAYNPEQLDSDFDGYGNACDSDSLNNNSGYIVPDEKLFTNLLNNNGNYLFIIDKSDTILQFMNLISSWSNQLFNNYPIIIKPSYKNSINYIEGNTKINVKDYGICLGILYKNKFTTKISFKIIFRNIDNMSSRKLLTNSIINEIDKDSDGINLLYDCNDNNNIYLASIDSDGDDVCDDKDKCINTYGKSPDGCPIKIKTDTITIKYEYSEHDNKLIGIHYQDTLPIKYSYSKYGNRISIISADSISNKELESIDENIENLKKYVSVDPENITIVNKSAYPFFTKTYKEEKYFIERPIQIYFLKSANKHQVKPFKFAEKINWLCSKINNNDSLAFILKSDKNTFEDCLQILPIYLDSFQLDTSNLLYQEIIEESFQLLNHLLSINQNTTYNSLLNDKILSSMLMGYIIAQTQVKGYFFPTICYNNKKDKKISKNTQAFYYTGKGAFLRGLKHPFEYGNNPHYELFGQQNYYIRYFKNDTIPIKDSIYFTPLKNLSNISIKQYSLNPLIDKVGFKSIVMVDYLNQKNKNEGSPLVGLSIEQEKILYEKINEINLSQNKYFIVRSIPFYEHKK